MENIEICGYVDHTLLQQTATWEEIKKLCEEGMKYNTASVCIPPVYVREAKEYVGDKLKICTVIGFPNGYHATSVKVFETKEAIKDGADEIDMVIHIGMAKMGNWKEIEKEIKEIKAACQGSVLKVIIETCLLTEEEKIKLCEVVTNAGADYIKTSTGFSTKGATFEDVALLKKHIGEQVQVKAAGGISSFADAKKFISLGASRLGTSKIVSLVEEEVDKL